MHDKKNRVSEYNYNRCNLSNPYCQGPCTQFKSPIIYSSMNTKHGQAAFRMFLEVEQIELYMNGNWRVCFITLYTISLMYILLDNKTLNGLY